MFSRKALPVGTLVVVLIIALAGLGLGYALWSTILYDTGTVTTGTFGAEWVGTFTDDGGHEDNLNRDAGDIPCATDGSCIYPKSGEGSLSARDPSGIGPNAPRYDKAIGHCWSIINAGEETILYWGADNTYPSYYCTVWSYIGSTGSVPMKVQARSLAYDTTKIAIGFVDGLDCGDQIDPNSQYEVGMWVHVLQGATPGATYTGNSSYTLVQWNEWSSGACSGW